MFWYQGLAVVGTRVMIKDIARGSLQETTLHIDILRVLLNSLGAIGDDYSGLLEASQDLGCLLGEITEPSRKFPIITNCFSRL